MHGVSSLAVRGEGLLDILLQLLHGGHPGGAPVLVRVGFRLVFPRLPRYGRRAGNLGIIRPAHTEARLRDEAKADAMQFVDQLDGGPRPLDIAAAAHQVGQQSLVHGLIDEAERFGKQGVENRPARRGVDGLAGAGDVDGCVQLHSAGKGPVPCLLY